jgi:hypothetical protein
LYAKARLIGAECLRFKLFEQKRGILFGGELPGNFIFILKEEILI